MSITNNAGIKRQPVDRYIISSAQVLQYLQNKLGFQVGADFIRWTGVTANHSYVLMRVVIDPKDIVAAQPASQLWAEKQLQENAAGIMYQEDVIETLRPFMFPEILDPNRLSREELEKMYKYGVYGQNLADIITKSKLTYSPEVKLFRVFLRPDMIIQSMLAEPTSNRIVMEGDDGQVYPAKLAITGVFGVESDTIRWEVEVSRGSMANTEIGIIDFEKIFS